MSPDVIGHIRGKNTGTCHSLYFICVGNYQGAALSQQVEPWGTQTPEAHSLKQPPDSGYDLDPAWLAAHG